MIELLSRVAEWLATPTNIGFIVLAIVMGPVLVLIIAAIFDPSQPSKVPGLFLGALVLLTGATIAGFAIFGVLLKFVIPQ